MKNIHNPNILSISLSFFLCNQMTQKFGLVWLKAFDSVRTLNEQGTEGHKEGYC